jgi:hypothetical protein
MPLSSKLCALKVTFGALFSAAMRAVIFGSTRFTARDHWSHPSETPMSRDPDSWYEEEYWEEIGRQEDIGKAIKNLSQQPIRDFLGTYGDAIDKRLDDIIAQARYARSRSSMPPASS